MSKRAPNPEAHVRQFIVTVADYENLEAAFPLTTSLPFVGAEEHRDRWILSLHTMVLRKYFAPRDALRLKLVVKSIQGCAVDRSEQINWVELVELVENVENVDELMEHVIGGTSFSESQIWTNRLYGRLLHGDYGKWIDEQNSLSDLDDFAIIIHTQALAARVHAVANLVHDLEKRGQISYQTPPGA